MQLRCPVVIGRDQALARLRTLVEDVRAGRGGALGLVGEAGVGKSRLAEAALQQAEDAALAGLVGRTTHVGQQTWLAPFSGALAGIVIPEIGDAAPAATGLRPLLAHLLPESAGVAYAPAVDAQIVERRLAALPPDTAAVVRAAAVLGRRFTPELLVAATGRRVDDLDAAVREAVAAQLLAADGETFRHALTREAVLATTPGTTRAAVARRAVDADVAFPADIEPVRAELLATAGAPDDAARLLAQVAQREAAAGALVVAANRLTRARELAVDRALAADLAVQHVRVLTIAGNLVDARRQAVATRPFLPVQRRIDVELALARSAVAAGDPSAAAVDLAAARSLMARDDRHWARLRAIEALVALVSPDDDRVRTAEHLAHRTVAAARELDDQPAECEAWLVVGRCARMRDLREAEEAFSLALDLANAAGLTTSRLRALHELGTPWRCSAT